MYQKIDQLNVSITTNRSCTLKCKHCYIEPELFLSKEQMSRETFIKVFDRVEELVRLDSNLKVVEWEAIGGETTMMPYEFWEEMLPLALKRIADINKLTEEDGSLNFLSNLIYKDKRYTGLLSKYKDHPLFCLYTSWEPDTNRFGNKDKMYPQFERNLKGIGSDRVILDLIMTKDLVSIEPKSLLEQFLPLGVADFSIKMLSPFGSGKSFFKHNMTSFQSMSEFLIKFDEATKGTKITFTPKEEMGGAFFKNQAFQCNGGFKYDLSIEPNGSTHFNANQTGSESATSAVEIVIDDPDWALKTLIENKAEESRRYTTTDTRCFTCPHYRFCCGGWYHYRNITDDSLDKYNKNECAGLRMFWDHVKSGLKDSVNVISDINYLESMTRNFAPPSERVLARVFNEVDFKNISYDSFLDNIKIASEVNLYNGVIQGKSKFERCLIYSDLSISVNVNDFSTSKDDANIIYSIFNKNLKNITVDNDVLLKALIDNSSDYRLNVICTIYDILGQGQEVSKINVLPLTEIKLGDTYYEITHSLIDRYFPNSTFSDDWVAKLSEQISVDKILNSGI